MASFESHLKEFRVQAGLSQEALARQLGVSRQTVVNIERGQNEPRVLLALALAAVLGAALTDLFSERTSTSPVERQDKLPRSLRASQRIHDGHM